jgi:PAS domain S-box-containing protein
LSDNEVQLEVIFENAPDAIVLTNEEGHITKWNPAAERLLGWTASEVKGQPIARLLDPGDNTLISCVSQLSQVQRKTIQFSAICKDATRVYVEISIFKAHFNSGYQLTCFLRDITQSLKENNEIKPLQAELEQHLDEAAKHYAKNEWKYKNLFENHPMPMWVLEVPSLKFLDVNESAVSQYGYSRDEFLGMTSFDIRPEEDKLRFGQLDRTAPGTQNRGIWRHHKKDGTIIYVEIIVHEIIYRKKQARLIMSMDVTERRKAQHELEVSEKRFRSIFDSKLIGFVVWNPDRGIIQANNVFLGMLGYTQQELAEGKISWDLLTPRDYAELDELALKQLQLTSVCDPIEKEYIRKDGSLLPVLVGAANIDKDLVVSYILDISEHKKMATEIFELNKNLERRIEERTNELMIANSELESFSYSVSHDLRAPLRAIHGYSQMALEDYEDKLDADGIRILKNIKANAKKMGQLVDDLLTFSRMGKVPLKRSVIDMDSIITSVLAAFREFDLNEAKVKVNELGTDIADPTLMYLVFQNLIANAVKYSSKKASPEIEIGAVETKGVKTYFVKDNGSGFDMKYYDKLFGVFQRLHTESEFEGTGVGLAIVRRIVSRHGGHVWAEAKVDEGATFYFILNDQT